LLRKVQSLLCAPQVQELKVALFQDVMRRILATGYRLFEKVYRPLFKRQAVLRPLKKGSEGSPETSAATFPPTPHYISEEPSPVI
jgi:hypothetical protein